MYARFHLIYVEIYKACKRNVENFKYGWCWNRNDRSRILINDIIWAVKFCPWMINDCIEYEEGTHLYLVLSIIAFSLLSFRLLSVILIVCKISPSLQKKLLGKCNDTCTLPEMNTKQICNERELHVLPHINNPGLFPWFVLLSKFSASSP